MERQEADWDAGDVRAFMNGYADSVCLPVCVDDLLEEYRSLRLFLTPIESDSQNGATRSGSDESEPEDEDDVGAWRIRRTMELVR